MLRALIQKELRHHWAVFALLVLLLACGMVMVGLMLMGKGFSSTMLDGIRVFLSLFLPLAAALLAGRLVVVEYRSKTQLFLEALPVRRWQVMAVKYLLGSFLLQAAVVLMLTLAAGFGAQHEFMTRRFAEILYARAGVYAAACYAFFFATGFLGRYRFLIYTLMTLAAFAVDHYTAWSIQKFAVFELLGPTFPHERHQFPMDNLVPALWITLGCTVLAFALATLREGNVSALLAEKMSHREKVIVAVIIFSTLLSISLIEEKRVKPPYDLKDAMTVTTKRVTVKITGSTEPATEIARYLADEMTAAGEYLGVARWPNVFVSERSDLDSDKYERGATEDASGVIMRANFASPTFRREDFLAWVLREVLDDYSHERATREDRSWIREGFSEYWAYRNQPGPNHLRLRAVYANACVPLEEKTIEGWFVFCEQVGARVAHGLAWSALVALRDGKGEEALQAFLRETLGHEYPHDFRASVHDWRNPTRRILERTTGWTIPEFIGKWREHLAREQSELGEALQKIPRLTHRVRFEARSANSIALFCEAEIAPASEEEIEYRIRYENLQPLNAQIDEAKMKDDVHLEAARIDEPGKPAMLNEHDLPTTFAPGDRVMIGVALRVPELGCDVISGWQRLTIPLPGVQAPVAAQ